MKTAVCAIAKLENHYIREWLEHYKNLGFTNAVVFDNNDPDGESIQDVTEDYISSGFLKIIDIRGEQKAQGKAYLTGYKLLSPDFDWIAFFDIDEFLMLGPKYKCVDEFLNEKMFSTADLIRVSWKMMSDSGHIRVENGDYSLVNRFTVPVENGHMWTKAIVRGGIEHFWFNVSDNDAAPHLVQVIGIKNAVNTCGERVSNLSIREKMTHENAWLNHYSMKTVEEFVTNKMKKGWAVNLDEGLLNKKLFFEQNEWSEEKEKLFDTLLEENDVDIFIFTHKSFETKRTNPVYKIVCCEGEDVTSDTLNIIKVDRHLANDGWLEWAKIYELYKNPDNIKEYVGLNHYHRYFDFGDDVNFIPNIQQLLLFSDLLICNPVYVSNVREQYAACHNIKDYDDCMQILFQKHPEYIDTINQVSNGQLLFASNLIITKKEYFLDLCGFIFDILLAWCSQNGIDPCKNEDFHNHIQSNISEYSKRHYKDDVNYSAQSRIPSYLAERLLTIWVMHNCKKIKVYKLRED